MSDNLIGATTAIFIVSLSIAVAEPVDVAWSTRDGTAKAGTDYQAANGVVTFLPGETEKQIEVIVYGQNVSPTGDKNFFINLMPPTNAVLGTALIEAVIKVEDEAGVPVTTVIVAQGKRGLKGDPGLSAYEQAVLMGYDGTLEDWMQEQADAAAAAQRASDYAAAAASAATKAESAATAASFLGNIFPTPEAGVDPVTGVQNGAYYNVRSPSDDSYLVEYQNVGGVPTPSGKSYPSSAALTEIKEAIIDPETNRAAANKVFLSDGYDLQTFSENWIDVTNLLLPGIGSETWNATVLNAAITKAKSLGKGITCAPRSTVYLDADIDFSGVTQIKFSANIENPTGTIIVGGDANKGSPTDIYFGSITNGTSPLTGAAPTKPTFQIKGIKTGKIVVGNTNHINIHATSGTATNSNAYFELYPSVTRYLSVTSDGSGNWNNEFYVIGGRLFKILVDGVGYVHNHLKFIRNTFEASSFTKVEMEFQRCHHVKVLDARFEGINAESTILFGSEASSCDIIGDWSGQNTPRSDFSTPPFTITDLGMGNYVGKDRLERFDRSVILDINGASKILANATESDYTDTRIGPAMSPLVNKPYLVPSFNGFSIGANRYLGLSDIIPVQYGDSLSYSCDYDHSDLRLAVFCYDENMNLLQDVFGGTEYFSQPSVTFSTTSFAYTAGPVAASYFNSISGSVCSPLVKYIRVGFFTAVHGYYRHVGINLHTQKGTENKRVSFAKIKQKDMVLSSSPTMGLASVGDSVNDSVSGGKYVCTFSRDSFTSAAYSSGQAEISVEHATGISVGDIVGIQLSTGLTQWTSVKSISSGSIIIDPLEADVAIRARAVFIRWKPTIVMQTMVYDPPSIPAKSTHSVIMDVANAVFANSVQASFNRFNAGISIDAAVSAANKVTVNFRNHSDSAVDLTSGTITVRLT